MRNTLLILALVASLSACGGGGDDNDVYSNTNVENQTITTTNNTNNTVTNATANPMTMPVSPVITPISQPVSSASCKDKEHGNHYGVTKKCNVTT